MKSDYKQESFSCENSDTVIQGSSGLNIFSPSLCMLYYKVAQI
jgi:hypothetical protein